MDPLGSRLHRAGDLLRGGTSLPGVQGGRANPRDQEVPRPHAGAVDLRETRFDQLLDRAGRPDVAGCKTGRGEEVQRRSRLVADPGQARPDQLLEDRRDLQVAQLRAVRRQVHLAAADQLRGDPGVALRVDHHEGAGRGGQLVAGLLGGLGEDRVVVERLEVEQAPASAAGTVDLVTQRAGEVATPGSAGDEREARAGEVRHEHLGGAVEEVQVVDDQDQTGRCQHCRESAEDLEVGDLLADRVREVLDDQRRERGESDAGRAVTTRHPVHRRPGAVELCRQGPEQVGAPDAGGAGHQGGAALERVGAEPLELLVASEGRHAWER